MRRHAKVVGSLNRHKQVQFSPHSKFHRISQILKKLFKAENLNQNFLISTKWKSRIIKIDRRGIILWIKSESGGPVVVAPTEVSELRIIEIFFNIFFLEI